MIFVQICTKLSCICDGILFKINYGDKISLLNIPFVCHNNFKKNLWWEVIFCTKTTFA